MSVVIPAYNCARYLAVAIRSVLEQTHQPNETIVVDDGSTDDTAEVARSFGPQVRVIEQANAGPSAARNAGAHMASSRWLAFLDADDESLPWRLQLQLACAERHPDVALWCGRTTDFSSRLTIDGSPTAGPPAMPTIRLLGLKDFTVSNPVPATTVLLRRDVFERVGGFDVHFRRAEDYDLWMRVATLAPVGHIDCPLVRYRERAGSLSMDYAGFLPEALDVIDKAYGPDGPLNALGGRDQAVAAQYASASWMAFAQGRRGRALLLLLQSGAAWPTGIGMASKPRWHRARLAWRYLRGRVDESAGADT